MVWLLDQGHGKSKIGVLEISRSGQGHVDEATGVGKKYADLCVPTLMLTRDHLPQEKALQPDGQMLYPTDVN